MKKILMSLFLVFMTFSLFSQDREHRTEKEIEKYYYEATNDYFVHSYDSAIVKLDILDFLYEDNSNIKFFLGMCYFFKADFNKSIAYYEQSLTDVEYTHDYQNGKYTPHIVYFYLGFANEKIGDNVDAIWYYEEYMKLEKDKGVIFNIEDRIEVIKLVYNIRN
jgi:tetratricopeptide (TPR) repeat protein